MPESMFFAVAGACFGAMALIYALTTQRKIDKLTEALIKARVISPDFDIEEEGRD